MSSDLVHEPSRDHISRTSCSLRSFAESTFQRSFSATLDHCRERLRTHSKCREHACDRQPPSSREYSAMGEVGRISVATCLSQRTLLASPPNRSSLPVARGDERGSTGCLSFESGYNSENAKENETACMSRSTSHGDFAALGTSTWDPTLYQRARSQQSTHDYSDCTLTETLKPSRDTFCGETPLVKKSLELDDDRYPERPPSAKSMCSDFGKFDTIKHTASNIIREKDYTIERLRSRMEELERRVNASDTPAYNYHPRCSSSSSQQWHPNSGHMYHPDYAAMKCKELELEVVSLRNMICQPNFHDVRVNELESLLGEREYEFEQLQREFGEELASKDQEMASLIEHVKTLEAELSEKDMELRGVQEDIDAKENELKKLKKYIGDLPTRDEHDTLLSEIKKLKSEYKEMKQEHVELKKKYLFAKKTARDQDKEGQKLKGELEKLKFENDNLRKQLVAIEGEDAQVDLQNLRKEKASVVVDLQTSNKMVSSLEQKIKSLTESYGAQVAELKSQICHDRDTLMVLQADNDEKSNMMEKLDRTIQQLLREKQELTSTMMTLQDRMATCEKVEMDRQVTDEMVKCFDELRSLVEICLELSDGRDVSVSKLLSLEESASSVPTSRQRSAGDLYQTVKNLRKDVKVMQQKISSKYAEELGDNFTCHIQ